MIWGAGTHILECCICVSGIGVFWRCFAQNQGVLQWQCPKKWGSFGRHKTGHLGKIMSCPKLLILLSNFCNIGVYGHKIPPKMGLLSGKFQQNWILGGWVKKKKTWVSEEKKWVLIWVLLKGVFGWYVQKIRDLLVRVPQNRGLKVWHLVHIIICECPMHLFPLPHDSEIKLWLWILYIIFNMQIHFSKYHCMCKIWIVYFICFKLKTIFTGWQLRLQDVP